MFLNNINIRVVVSKNQKLSFAVSSSTIKQARDTTFLIAHAQCEHTNSIGRLKKMLHKELDN
jgi:hypothetical protein